MSSRGVRGKEYSYSSDSGISSSSQSNVYSTLPNMNNSITRSTSKSAFEKFFKRHKFFEHKQMSSANYKKIISTLLGCALVLLVFVVNYNFSVLKHIHAKKNYNAMRDKDLQMEEFLDMGKNEEEVSEFDADEREKQNDDYLESSDEIIFVNDEIDGNEDQDQENLPETSDNAIDNYRIFESQLVAKTGDFDVNGLFNFLKENVDNTVAEGSLVVSGSTKKKAGLIVAIKQTCCWFYFKRRNAYRNLGFNVLTRKYDNVTHLNLQHAANMNFIKKFSVVVCLTRFECWNEQLYSHIENLRQPIATNRILFAKDIWSTKSGFCNTLKRAFDFDNNMQQSREIVDLFTFYCFVLPRDFDKLLTDATTYPEGKYIIKPQAAQAGNAIFVRSAEDIQSGKLSKTKPYLAQPYLLKPFLIDGRKFDMRIHVIVTNVLPMRMYLHPLAFARFAADKYDTKSSKRSSFLTNISVNNKIIPTDQLTWQFKQFFEYLDQSLGINSVQLFRNMRHAIAKVLLLTENEFRFAYQNHERLTEGFKCKNCYQTLGIDVILTENLGVKIIEINGNPTMDFTAKKLNDDATEFQNEMVQLMSFDEQPVLKKVESLEGYGLSNEEMKYVVDLETEQNNIKTKNLKFHQLYPPIIFDESEDKDWDALLESMRFNKDEVLKHERINLHKKLVALEKEKVKSCIAKNRKSFASCGLDVESGCKVFPYSQLCKQGLSQ